MPRLMRAHFASIGHRDARLAPLTLDLRADGVGSGLDSVLWLRNGGGKSSILNLFFSVLRPRVRDFLGAAAEGKSRRLADYVKEGDLAAVVTEWDLTPRLADLRRAPEKICLLGQVMGWKGQQRSSDESRLRRLFFGLLAAPDLNLEDLPLQGLGAPATTFEGFREWLSALKSGRPELEVYYTENFQPWERHLTGLGVDPELMRVQIQMNLREGAADELFRFTSPRDFIDFFLQLAMDFEKASELSANLEALRGRLAQRPALLLERELFDAVLPALEGLAAAVVDRGEAARALAAAIDLAARTASGLGQRLDAFARRREDRLAEAREAAEKTRAASNEGDSRRRWAVGLDRLAVQLAVDEAERALKVVQEEHDAAKRRVRVVEAAQVLAEVRELDAQIAAKQEALDRTNAELAPLKADLDAAGSRLRAVLRRSDALLAEAEAAAREREAEAEAERRRLDDERNRITAERTGVDHELRALRGHLSARDGARDTLTREKVIDSYEDAAHALGRWREREAAAEALRDQAAARRIEIAEAREANAVELRRLERERAEATTQARGAETTLQGARAWQEKLRALPALGELQGVDQPDLEQPRLVALLRQHADDACRQHLVRSVDAAEDQRALAALEQDGLLPPARDVEHLLRALKERKVLAHAGARYLVDNASPAEAAALAAADPQRHSGVIVMRQEDLAAAQALSPELLRLRAPVQVSLASDPGPTAATSAYVVLPDPALHDRIAGAERRRELTDAHQRRAQDLEALHRREESFARAADELARFLDAWGKGRLDQHEALLRSLTERGARLGHQIEAGEARAAEFEAADKAAAQEAQEAERDRQGASKAGDRIAAFIESHDRHVDGWKAELDRLQRAQDELVGRLDRALAAIEDARKASRLAQSRVIELEHDRADLRRSVAAVSHHGPDVDPGETSEAEARARYDELRELYERRTSENRLQWELDQLRERARKRASELDALIARGLVRADVEATCDRGALPGERADAEAALESTRSRLARAELERNAAKDALRETQRRREAADLPPDRPRPATSVDAREAALRCREEAQRFTADEEAHRLREAAATRDADALGRRLTHHQGALEILLETAGELPGRPPRALPEDDGVLDQDLGELRRALRSSRDRADEAREAARIAAEHVRHLASDERFTGLRSQARERLRGDLGELQERAQEFAGELSTARAILQRDLDELDEHRRVLLDNLVAVGENAAYLLRQATRASALPADLDAWSGKHYLKIDLQIPDAEADKRARLEPLIDRLMESATIPGPVKLVQETVFELAGGRHDAFRVTVLKPDAVLRPDPIPIELLSTFSRGQQLTASILLYCTIVQLRARRRGRGGRLSDAGVLILDNPIGTCSSRALLDIQRMIALRMGVQLVYTTGVEDADAIAVLPNTIRLRNAHRDRRSGDLHVTHEGGEGEGVVDGVRIEARRA